MMSKRVSWITQTVFYWSLGGFFLFLIVSLAMCKHKQPGSFVVRSGLGTSGWRDGTAWVLGITNAMYAFAGPDAGEIHAPTSKLLTTKYHADTDRAKSDPYQ